MTRFVDPSLTRVSPTSPAPARPTRPLWRRDGLTPSLTLAAATLAVALLAPVLLGGCSDGSAAVPPDAGAAADAGGADAPDGAGAADGAAGDLAANDDVYRPPVEGCAADRSTVLRIHYRNDTLASAYDRLFVWTWEAWEPEKDVPVCGRDEFGAVFDVPREWLAPGARMGFKFKRGPGTAGPWYEFDRAWTEGVDCWEVWTVKDDATLYCSPEEAALPKIVAAFWDSPTEVFVTLSRAVEGADALASWSLTGGATLAAATATGTTGTAVKLVTAAPLEVRTCYTLTLQTPEGPISNALYPRRVLDTFQTTLLLGTWIDAGDSHFRVFAPRASAVVLHTAATADGPENGAHDMRYEAAHGTWYHVLDGNQHGLYYWFTVDGPTCKGERFDPTKPLNDPYAPIALSSFGGVAGRSLFFDLSRLGPKTTVARRPPQDLVAWEVHVRDLTASPDSGLPADDPARLRYLGFTKTGLTGPTTAAGEPVTTGLDHIVELGVNAVQLLPVHEFPADPARFNWGYFTANFFSPEGMYATRADDETRAFELKALIDALHAQGVAVILDVVFNHSAEGSELGPHINFKGFDSKYYYRQDPFSYTYRNGSGVGNELASERPMVRRYIIDCLRFWVERYGVDGFRFDLAALHDTHTMRTIAQEFPDLYLYGEPWAASGALWGKGAVNAMDPWAVFNDDFRNAVKGSPEGTDRGFVQGGGSIPRLKLAVTGNSLDVGRDTPWADAPTDALNYLDAHDNLTLADKLAVSIPGLTMAEKEARTKLAAAITFTSLGPIMLHAGVEFLRTKPYIAPEQGGGDGRPIESADGDAVFDANSYSSPDETNQLVWQQKADHIDVFRYFRDLTALRLSNLGTPTRPAGPVTLDYVTWFEADGNPSALGWELNADRSNGDQRLRVFVNASATAEALFDVEFPRPQGWRQLADETTVDPTGATPAPEGALLAVPPLGIRIYADQFAGE
jgi:pullulanase/glycogen debranching enzyme